MRPTLDFGNLWHILLNTSVWCNLGIPGNPTLGNSFPGVPGQKKKSMTPTTQKKADHKVAGDPLYPRSPPLTSASVKFMPLK